MCGGRIWSGCGGEGCVMRRLTLAALIAAVPFGANAANVEEEHHPTSTLGAQLKCRELGEKELSDQLSGQRSSTWSFSYAFYSRKADRCFFRYLMVGSDLYSYAELVHDAIAPSVSSAWTGKYRNSERGDCSDNVKILIHGCPANLKAFIEMLR